MFFFLVLGHFLSFRTSVFSYFRTSVLRFRTSVFKFKDKCFQVLGQVFLSFRTNVFFKI